LIVNKYLGMHLKPEGFRYDIVAQQGLVLHQSTTPATTVAASVAASRARLSDTLARTAERGRASFASMVLNQASAARPGSAGTGVPPPARGGAGGGG
jgi:hypothetical protein